MVKSYVKRIAATAVMTAVCLGATVQIGLPDVAYAVDTSDKEVMMTINGTDILKNEYVDYYSYCKAMMESTYGMGEYLWSMYPDVAQQLTAITDNNCLYSHTVIEKFNELGLNLDRARDKAWRGSAWDLKQDKNEKKAQLKQQGSTFDKWLASMGMDEQMYDNIFAMGYYYEVLEDYYLGVNGKNAPAEDEIKAEFEKFYKAKHILIMNIDEYGQELTGDALAEKEALVKQIQDELANGADFDELINKYSEDIINESNADGYIFDENGNLINEPSKLVDEFVKGTAALEIGEISSEPVKSDYGWHIIKREKLTDEDYETYRPQLVYNLTGMTIDSLIEQWMSEAEVTYPEGHEDLTITDILGEEAGNVPSMEDLLGGSSSTTDDGTSSTNTDGAASSSAASSSAE